MKLIQIGKYKKFKIGFSENKDLLIEDYKILTNKIAANSNKINKTRFVECEIALPLHASSYAFLGVEFAPNEEEFLNIEVRYNESKEEYKQTLSMCGGVTYKGLPEEFVNAVYKSILQFFEYGAEIPCGKLTVKTAANCEVGSSNVIFACLIKIVLDILFGGYVNLTDGQIEEICENRLKQRYNF